MGDDGVGCRVAELLRDASVAVTDCGVAPENHLGELRHMKGTLLIVDAVDMGLEPGETRIMTLDDVGAGVVETSHGVPLSALLAPFRDSMEMLVLGIQPGQRELGRAPSPAVERAAVRVSESIIRGDWRRS
jgi:hydrogenase 3 maturation protease